MVSPSITLSNLPNVTLRVRVTHGKGSYSLLQEYREVESVELFMGGEEYSLIAVKKQDGRVSAT